MKKTLVLSSILALSLSPMFPKPFNIDKSHSSVGFQVTHMMISDVEGQFNNFSGSVDYDIASKTLKALSGEVEISSIDTKNASRDKHLNANDFFDSAKFPKATLVAKDIKGDKLTADLTLRGVTKPVTFDVSVKGPVENPMTKKQTIAIKLEGKINRKDFEVGKETGNAMVSDEVKIKISIEANEITK
ncbi:YceI family protein [uncultured Helicobacter sp.]|uniref:YceI family protein n=1 Tax=uncultured Helicobacter sp. TaxID=175537 RepID=UPI00258B1CA8|nr:YceI family protein [uncultured Helicobacter sp.]